MKEQIKQKEAMSQQAGFAYRRIMVMLSYDWMNDANFVNTIHLVIFIDSMLYINYFYAIHISSIEDFHADRTIG